MHWPAGDNLPRLENQVLLRLSNDLVSRLICLLSKKSVLFELLIVFNWSTMSTLSIVVTFTVK